jgi:ribosomal protein L20
MFVCVNRHSKERKMHKDKIFKLAKGFRGRAKNCIRIARERVEKALQYSYRDRRNKKRDMRSLWIQRINAGTRQHGVCFSFLLIFHSFLLFWLISLLGTCILFAN